MAKSLKNKMLRVGITGGIGSGKTTVCELFAALGIPVYNSDARARKLMDSPEVKAAIINLFGAEAYRGNTSDNAFIASKVFTDKMLLASLNAIIHPAVARDFEAWALSVERPTAPAYLLLESAILFESGFHRFVDKTITVSAPEPLRIERALSRRNVTGAEIDTDALIENGTAEAVATLSREQILERIANQLTDSEREARADYTIRNDDTLDKLTARVVEIDKLLKK